MTRRRSDSSEGATTTAERSHEGAAPMTGGVADSLAVRHLRIGWWTLLTFLSLGITLEALHGFKSDLYLNLANETRRLMWTLTHAHGVLLGLVHIAFAATLTLGPRRAPSAERGTSWARLASIGLSGATVLLPGGFFLGGTVLHGGDPGRGILLVPFGAALLFGAVLLTALRAGRVA